MKVYAALDEYSTGYSKGIPGEIVKKISKPKNKGGISISPKDTMNK